MVPDLKKSRKERKKEKLPTPGLIWQSSALRLHASKAGSLGSIPGQGTKISHDTWQHKNKHTSKQTNNLPTPLGFPCGSAGKESACNAGDQGLIPGLGRSPGEGKGYPLQYPGLENSVYGVANSQTQLNEFHFHFPTPLYNYHTNVRRDI